jgi:cytochrome c peroxidase
MKKLIAITTLLAALTVAISCHKSVVAPQGTTYLDLNTNNSYYFARSYGFSDTSTENKATLGRVLFYDGHLSLNNAISCASCHKQVTGFADNTAFSTGFEGRLTRRNSKGIHNLAGVDSVFFASNITTSSQPLFWDGRENNLVSLVNRPITNHVEMGISAPRTLPEKLAALSCYPPLFSKAYGDASITSARISECISIFMAAIRSSNSRFDQFQHGNTTILNSLEQQGYNLFFNKYNCNNCHHVVNNSYSFSDFHDIGLDKNYTDLGFGAAFSSSANNGKFRVPSLVNVALTAPYMHDGRFKTLSEVIDHYSQGIQNSPNLDPLLMAKDSTPMQMNISGQEKAALIAFLYTMTDYTTITDIKFSNPFKVK